MAEWSYVPGVYPVAIRAGYPSARTSTAIALANCWQNPRRVVMTNRARKFVS